MFFSVVPTSGDSALFFDRYMIPVTPAFLVLVCVGIFTIASWAGTWRVLVAVVLVAGLAAIEVRFDLAHRRATQRIGVDSVVAAVRHEPAGTVLFGSTGTSGANFSAFDYGHPANLLDHLVALRVPSLTRVDDEACANLAPVPAHHGSRATACGSSTRRHPTRRPPQNGRSARSRSTATTSRSGRARRSRRARSFARVCDCALAWKQAVPFNRRVDELLLADRSALAGTCVAVR